MAEESKACSVPARNSTRGKRTHGKSKTPLYRVWVSMKARCYNEANEMYPHYGARGIVVCDRWRFSFESFLADMGSRPSMRHSIDRVDNDGPYSPENCRWATVGEQARNRTNTVATRFNGEQMVAKDLAVCIDRPYMTIKARLQKGMSAEEAAALPPGHVSLNPSSGYRGVYLHPKRSGKCWQAKLMSKKKTTSLGYYETPEEAALAYNAGALRAFGHGAYQNKI